MADPSPSPAQGAGYFRCVFVFVLTAARSPNCRAINFSGIRVGEVFSPLTHAHTNHESRLCVHSAVLVNKDLETSGDECVTAGAWGHDKSDIIQRGRHLNMNKRAPWKEQTALLRGRSFVWPGTVCKLGCPQSRWGSSRGFPRVALLAFGA